MSISDDIYRKALEQANDAIFITDINGHILFTNPSFQDMTGYTFVEVSGKTPRIIKSGLHDKKFYNRLWGTILKGKTFRDTVTNRRKDGKLFTVDHTITPIRNSKGALNGFIGIWKDVTEAKKTERLKDDFINIASHELKTPLTSINAYSQILKKELDLIYPKKIRDRILRMSSQLDRLTSLVKELLDTTRITEGKINLRISQFDADSVVHETISEIKAVFPKSKVEFINNPGENIFADRNKFSEVVENLVTNAIKFSPTGSPIKVETEQKDKFFFFRIKDLGKGIPETEKKAVFERFYQGKQGIYPSGPGLGLGLYISKAIIEAHNGNIWLDNSQNLGTVVYFRIPIKTKSSGKN